MPLGEHNHNQIPPRSSGEDFPRLTEERKVSTMRRFFKPSTTRRLLALTAGLLCVAAALSAPASAAAPSRSPSPPAPQAPEGLTPQALPAPPITVIKPKPPTNYKAPSTIGPRPQASANALAAPAGAKTFGAAGKSTTLVLYDTTAAFGWLGELYALGAGTLATHFGLATTEPVSSYTQGQMSQFTATIYLGSTYNEPIPAAFLTDVLTGTKPVIWAGANVWQLSGTAATSASFQQKYGWDASTSYYDTVDQFTNVVYNASTLTRSALNGGLLVPHITTGTGVTVLGTAPCTSAGNVSKPCDGIAQVAAGATSVPWAIQSANLTYISEIPLSYMTESDRYLAFADLLYPALDPTAAVVRRAMVRLEDLNPGDSDPTQMRQIADYLSQQGVPFSVGVIPAYRDPLGVETGTPVSLDISQTTNAKVKAFDSALNYMVSKGGTLVQHGYTHQLNSVANPYDAVSGDDFEFYTAHCSQTQGGPVDPNGCPVTDWVVQTGPVPGDTQQAAATRVSTGRSLFAKAGVSTPTIFETPHYSASAADYAGMRQTYSVRYEREQFFSGQLSGAPPDYTRLFGQFFPYSVNDIYNTRVLPEDLGNYEPVTFDNNPPRLATDLVNNARAELAIRQGVASFFYHPFYGLAPLQATVQGIKALGYTFVSPATLIAAG